MHYATDNELAEARNNPPEYTDYERGQDIEDKAWELQCDDEAMADAVSDLITGIVTKEERRLTAGVGRQVPTSREIQDARAREAIRIIRALPNDNRLTVLVLGELKDAAARLVDREAA